MIYRLDSSPSEPNPRPPVPALPLSLSPLGRPSRRATIPQEERKRRGTLASVSTLGLSLFAWPVGYLIAFMGEMTSFGDGLFHCPDAITLSEYLTLLA